MMVFEMENGLVENGELWLLDLKRYRKDGRYIVK